LHVEENGFFIKRSLQGLREIIKLQPLDVTKVYSVGITHYNITQGK